jgi:Txe/YoeB family toxin of Txe-Axe toxin-antitoxin module
VQIADIVYYKFWFLSSGQERKEMEGRGDSTTVMYEVWLTRDAQKFYEDADDPLARRLNRCFEQLQRNPYEYPDIKRLEGPLAGHWRYRVAIDVGYTA